MEKFELLLWVWGRGENLFYVCFSFLVVERLLSVPLDHVVLVLAAIARITSRNNVRQSVRASLADWLYMLYLKL